jgi:hypothetical protein
MRNLIYLHLIHIVAINFFETDYPTSRSEKMIENTVFSNKKSNFEKKI